MVKTILEENRMKRHINLIAIIALAVFSLAVENVNAQSGSRGGGSSVSRGGGGGVSRGSFGSGSRGRSGLSAAEINAQRLLAQQQFLQQQRESAEIQRKQFLQQLSSNPNSSQNRRQLIEAFNEAKLEYKAIHNGQLAANGRKLTKVFVLRSKQLDRETKEIKWPKTFENEPHADLVSKIEKVITGEGEDDIGMLLQKLSQQLEQRVVDKSIAIKEYATAKRFVSGLAYEAEL